MFVVLFGFALFAQVSPDLSFAGEAYLDNLYRCDNFYCEFSLEKVEIEDGSVESFRAGEFNPYATCRVKWWKCGKIELYVMDRVNNYRDPVESQGRLMVDGWLERAILTDGRHAFVLTGGSVGQIFPPENAFPGPRITPLNFGILGPKLGIAPGYVIREAGKFLSVEQEKITPKQIVFRTSPIEKGLGVPTVSYELDPLRNMSLVKLSIASRNYRSTARAVEFKRLNDAWFPSLITYIKHPEASSPAGKATVIRVKKLRDFTAVETLSLDIPEGTILNDDTEDHAQVINSRNRTITPADLPNLMRDLSHPVGDAGLSQRSASGSGFARYILGGFGLLALVYGLVRIRRIARARPEKS